MDGEGPLGRGGHRARQHRARPAGPGAQLALPGRADRGARPRRGCARLLQGRGGVPQPVAGGAAERRLRLHHRAPVPLRRAGAPAARAARLRRGQGVRRHRREVPEGDQLPHPPQRVVAGAARRRDGREPRQGRGRARGARPLLRRDVLGRPRRRAPRRCRYRARRGRAARPLAAHRRRGLRPHLRHGQPDGWCGQLGRHTEHLGYVLAEMQRLPRAHPGASW